MISKFWQKSIPIFFIVSLGICLPLIHLNSVIDPVLNARFLWIGMITAVLLIAAKIQGKNFYVPGSKIGWPIIFLILALSFASILTSINKMEGIGRVLQLSMMCLFTLTIFSCLINEILNYKTLFIGVGIAGIIFMSIGYYQTMLYYFQHGHLPVDQKEIVSTMANKNLLASALLMCLPSYIIQLITDRRKVIQFLASIFVLLGLIMLWMIHSKASLLALILMTFLVVVALFINALKYRFKKQSRSIKLIGMMLLIFLVSSGIIGLKSTFQKEYNKLSSTLVTLKTDVPNPYASPSTETRVKLYHNTSKMILGSPLLGVGPGNWRICFPCSGINQFGGSIKDGLMNFQRAHSDVLQFISEFGIISFLLVLFLCLFLLVKMIKAIRRFANRRNQLITSIILAFFLSYAIVLLFDFSLERPTQLSLLGIYLAFTFYFIESSTKKITTKWTAFLSLSCCILFMIFCSLRLKGEYYSKDLGHLNERLTIKYEEKANSLAYQLDPFSIPTKWYSGVAHYAQSNYSLALQDFEEAYLLNPCQLHVINNLASTYIQLGNPDKAIENYQRALAISPYFEESIINLSAVYFNQNQFKLAFETISLCPVTSEHINFQPYLKAILRAYANELNRQHQFSDQDLKDLYYRSISPDQTFEDYLNPH